MKYTILKNVYIDKDEITEIKAIEHDTKTRFINLKFIGSNTVVDLTDCQVRVYAKNSRYIEIFNDLTIIDAKRGIAQLELTDKMLRVGITEYQLKIMPINGGQLSSNTMKIIVSEDLMKDTAIESSNEYKTFEIALNKIDKYDIRLRNVEDNWQDENVKTKDSVLFENATLRASDKLTYNNHDIYDTDHKPTPADIGASPSDHNHDTRYLKTEDVQFASGELKAGDKTLANINPTVFWEKKDGGWVFDEGKTIVLPKKISDMPHGLKLLWSSRSGSTVHNWNWHWSFIPKDHLSIGGGIFLVVPYNDDQVTTKRVILTDTSIQGSNKNMEGNSTNVVLRKVVEW